MSEIQVMHDLEYARLLQEVLDKGVPVQDRTGVGTYSMFGGRMEFDLRHAFPLLTGKKIHWRSVVEELLWFLRGETNIKTLNASIWNEWADKDGECGPIYGYQWRHWGKNTRDLEPKIVEFQGMELSVLGGSFESLGIDQFRELVLGLVRNPHGRRHIVSAWNVSDLDRMALPPCHLLYQFHVREGYLECQMYQRSCDMFLGVPFNIASYSLLTHIVAYITQLKPGRFIWIGGDCHIYKNHLDQVDEYLGRSFRPSPVLTLEPTQIRGIDNWKFEDFKLTGYDPHGTIKAEVAV